MNTTCMTILAPGISAELIDSTDILNDAAALQRRGTDQGYLFFRKLLPPEAVLRVRTDILRVSDRWLVGDPTEGKLDSETIASIPPERLRGDIGISEDGYVRVQQVQSMHALPHHPALIDLYRRLFGAEVFVHPRHIVRVMTDHPALSPTPAHQDYPLVQGSQHTWTAWFPLGECRQDLGSLCVLPRSHKNGYIPISYASGAGGIEAQLCRGEDNWASTDFEAGDVLTFPAYTVHKSLPPVDRSHVRLSMDVRFQPAHEPIEAKALMNHAGADWADIYDGWPTDSLQYYWEGTTPRISPWDESLIQPGRRIC